MTVRRAKVHEDSALDAKPEAGPKERKRRDTGGAHGAL